MAYFDIHLHTSSKAFLSHYKFHKKKSCWKEIKAGLIVDEWYFNGDRLDSQSCLSQIVRGNIRLGVIPLHAFEREFAATSFFKLINTFSFKLSNRLLKKIRKNKIGYFELIEGELKLLRKSAAEHPGRLNFLLSIDNNTEIEPYTFNVFFSFEGGHCFMDKTERVDSFDQSSTSLIDRFQGFLTSNTDVRVVFLTLTHIARNPLATQSFSFPRPKERQVAEHFLPKDIALADGSTQGGIHESGWNLIIACLENERRTLIDVKHLGYRSRIQYYKYITENCPDTPVIASHMGSSGYSFHELRVSDDWKPDGKFHHTHRLRITRAHGLMNTRFYPLTINLMDEEVRFIVDSEGIIGLSLDERILGFKKFKKKKYWDMEADKDYFTEADYSYLSGNEYIQDTSFFNYTPPATTYESLPGSLTVEEVCRTGTLGDVHMFYLCNNILRFVYAGGEMTWKSLCIGSDYDGLIDAIEDVKTADLIPFLRGKIKPFIITMMQTVPNYDKVFHVDLQNLEKDIDGKLDDIFYYNGFHFLKNNF